MQDNHDSEPRTHLASLIGDVPDPDTGLWQRLDMEGMARRLIQTARLATAETILLRAEDAIRRRNERAQDRQTA